MLLSFVLAALVSVSSVSSLATPRASHLHARHAALHARVAAAEPLSAPQAVNRTKRQTGKCKPRPSSIAASSAAATSSKATPSSTPVSQPSAAPVNVAPAPPPPAPPAPKPSPTTTPKAAPPPTTTPTAPKSTPTSNNGGSGGGGATPFGNFMAGIQTGGDGTFYTPGLGACGETNDESQLVAAIPFGMFGTVPGYNGANPNDNPACGHEIKVSYQGNSVTVKVVDECMGCFINTSLDMSPTAFQILAPLSVGRIHGITWEWAS